MKKVYVLFTACLIALLIGCSKDEAKPVTQKAPENKQRETVEPTPQPVPTTTSSQPQAKNLCSQMPEDNRVLLNRNCTRGVMARPSQLEIEVQNIPSNNNLECELLKAGSLYTDYIYHTVVITVSGDYSPQTKNEIRQQYFALGVIIDDLQKTGVLRGGFRPDFVPSNGDQFAISGAWFVSSGTARLSLTPKSYCELTGNIRRDLTVDDLRKIITLTADYGDLKQTF